MSAEAQAGQSARRETGWFFAVFAVAALFNLWAVRVGWESLNLPGLEFRQAQTAISADFIQQTRDFSPAYPTPVLGKPWSVPMEFPLYQWTVVVVSDVTGLSLTKAGRAVSIVCFYLTLPAVFLALRRLGVRRGHRWLMLAVVLTCPFYIFYSRAFLIETMALMFSWWFWVAFEHAVEDRHRGWLLLAWLAGSGAGLAKVTTFIVFLVPAGWWAGSRLWRQRRERTLLTETGWMILAVSVPFLIAGWWVYFSAATRGLNPSAGFLLGKQMRGFNLGSLAERFSSELWRQKWMIVAEQLSWRPVLLIGGVAMALSFRQRGREVGSLLLWFAAALVIFPGLYARHEYYFVANGLFLLLALGLGVVGIAESGRARWMTPVLMAVLIGAQVWHYFDGYYRAQSPISPGGSGLTRSLHDLTAPDEVLVITGQDWNAMTPYYARRRALMIREDAEKNLPQVDAALAALAGEKIGALVLGPATQNQAELVRRLEGRGIDPRPLYRWHDVSVYVPASRRRDSVIRIFETGYEGLTWAEGVEPPYQELRGAWHETKSIRPFPRQIFSQMQPAPVRFYSTFGIGIDGSRGMTLFSLHPVTRLVFAVPAGPRVLRTSVFFAPEAYAANLTDGDSTDGVEFTLTLREPGQEPQVILRRLIDPRHQTGDRGMVPIELSFIAKEGAEMELAAEAGPHGRDTRDWLWLGALKIE